MYDFCGDSWPVDMLFDPQLCLGSTLVYTVIVELFQHCSAHWGWHYDTSFSEDNAIYQA